MKIVLSRSEKQFLNEVLTELKQYQISSKDRRNIKLQLLEHIQEAREHGDDSLNGLGDSTTFVKDFLDLNEIDLYSEIKQLRTPRSRRGTLLIIGSCALIVTYLFSQFVLSLFLTEVFNPQSNHSFHYHLLYRISDDAWWNSLLIMISFFTSLAVSLLVVFFYEKNGELFYERTNRYY